MTCTGAIDTLTVDGNLAYVHLHNAGVDPAATTIQTIGLAYSSLYGSNSLSQAVKLAFSMKF